MNKIQDTKYKIQNTNKGITLIEVTVASIILTIVSFSFVSLLALGIDSFYFSKEKSQAIALAQEGLEVTRSVRDTISTSATSGSGATGQIGAGWINGFASPSKFPTGDYCVPANPTTVDPVTKIKELKRCIINASNECTLTDPNNVCTNNDNAETGTQRTNLEVNLPFTLKINISPAASLGQAGGVDNAKIITATVTWPHRGLTKTVQLQTMLTRWEALE